MTHYGFHLHFSNDQWCWTTFRVLVDDHLWRNIYSGLLPIFELGCLLLLSCRSLYYGYSTLIRFSAVFFLFCGCLSTFLTVFWYTEVLNFDEVQFTYLSSVACTFGVMFKKPLANPRSWKLPLCFLLKAYSFSSSGSWIQFKFIFITVYTVISVQLRSVACGYPLQLPSAIC